MVLMTKMDQDKQVILQISVKESIRTRLKLQAVQLGTTMGELADKLLDEALTNLEQQEVKK